VAKVYIERARVSASRHKIHRFFWNFLHMLSRSSSIGQVTDDLILNCLKQADYHGAHITVIKSKCKHLIGLSGIVLQDKKNVFSVLTEKNAIKCVPKSDNIFQVKIEPHFKFNLIGTNLCLKTVNRICKTVKPKTNINLF
jgi:ribonuclease P protein subunit POP4